jgi:hypothetical protein
VLSLGQHGAGAAISEQSCRSVGPTFGEGFNELQWLDRTKEFPGFGQGLATIYLNRVDKKRFAIINNKAVEAISLFGVQVPVALGGFCHCSSCRSWAAAPVNAFSLWKPDAVKVTKGEGNIGVYHKTDKSYRKFCKTCGGHLLTDHPPFGLIDVYAATIPTYRHQPALHVHYAETVLRIKDGLPKMKDMPKEMGGSGATLPE